MKNSRFERLRSWLIMRIAGMMNVNSDWVIGVGCSTDERWLMELGWWLEARLMDLFVRVYEGSDAELADIDANDLQIDQMSERQFAYWLDRTLPEGGAS